MQKCIHTWEVFFALKLGTLCSHFQLVTDNMDMLFCVTPSINAPITDISNQELYKIHADDCRTCCSHLLNNQLMACSVFYSPKLIYDNFLYTPFSNPSEF